VLHEEFGLLLMSTIRMASASDAAGIRALLLQSGLPVADLGTADIAFFVADGDAGPVGVVGIERYGSTGLLRSLAVAAEHRRTGLGEALLARAQAHASEVAGIEELVLLTTTAADFFARRGYAVIARDAAPAGVQASAEFRSICPASATCMRKPLRVPA